MTDTPDHTRAKADDAATGDSPRARRRVGPASAEATGPKSGRRLPGKKGTGNAGVAPKGQRRLLAERRAAALAERAATARASLVTAPDPVAPQDPEADAETAADSPLNARAGRRNRPPRPAPDTDPFDPDDDEPVTLADPDGSPKGFAAGPIELPPPARQRLFSRMTRLAFLVMVALPVLASAWYFTTVASPRYAVDVQFAIRSPAGLPTSDLIGMVTGGTAAGSTQSDSYMVVEFLQSRQFLDELATRLDLAAIYSTDAADPLYRLPADATKEEQVDYLPRMIDPYYDSTSQIVTVEVQAFTPEDARAVAEAVLDAASTMVNRVSEQARQDTVRLAEQELLRAENALKDQRAAIATFRDSEQKIDPNRTAAAQESVLAGLEAELANTRASMTGLREFLSADAPSVRVLQSRIASIEAQLATERARLGSGGTPPENDATTAPAAQGNTASGESLNAVVTRYEELAVDLEFRQRTYLSALGSLEAARVEADRQQRYVATFVHPALPEEARYPRILLSLALITVSCFLIWSILTMSIHVVREHMR